MIKPCPCSRCEPLVADERDVVQPMAEHPGRQDALPITSDREQLLASLVELRELIRRQGGYMKAEDQQTLRHVDDVIAAAMEQP